VRSTYVTNEFNEGKEAAMLSRTAHAGLWTPPNETVAAIGATLCAHWAAAKAATKSPFWRKTPSWLDLPRPQTQKARYHFTMGGRLMR
jgi:hypothetical protein